MKFSWILIYFRFNNHKKIDIYFLIAVAAVYCFKKINTKNFNQETVLRMMSKMFGPLK